MHKYMNSLRRWHVVTTCHPILFSFMEKHVVATCRPTLWSGTWWLRAPYTMKKHVPGTWNSGELILIGTE